jgi:hypothetical protein
VTYGTGNNDVRGNLNGDAVKLDLTIAPNAAAGSTTVHAISQHLQPCLRDNECSQQQLVRLVGYRGPVVASPSWDRLRREQAALQAR